MQEKATKSHGMRIGVVEDFFGFCRRQDRIVLLTEVGATDPKRSDFRCRVILRVLEK